MPRPKNSKRNYDANGWYAVDANPIARSGILDYLGSQISPDLEPDRIYKVWRPESELNNPETIRSFHQIPWLNRHEMIGMNFTPAERVGIQGTTGKDVYYDKADGTLKADIKAYGSNLIEMIDQGVRDLSIGMTCDWVIQGGITPDGQQYDVIQTNIRGNHLASVPVGRAGGNVAVMDSADVLTFAMDELNFQKTEQNEGKTMTIEEILAALKELKPSLDQMKEIQSALASLGGEPEEDEPEDKPAMDVDQEDDPEMQAPKGAMDAAAIQSMIDAAVEKRVAKSVKGLAIDEAALTKKITAGINAKNALADKVFPLTGAFDHSNMSEQDVAKYAADKLKIACDSGFEVHAVKGYLAAQKPQEIIRDSNAQDNAAPVKSKTSEEMGL